MVWQSRYTLESETVDSCGLELGTDEGHAVAADVQAILADTTGQLDAQQALEHVPTTEFEREALREIIESAAGRVEEWRVGEAVAELHLRDEHGCNFPWPHSRSVRNPRSIDGGVDLIGFDMRNGGGRFAIGEAKTSAQATRPPSVMTGRHGLSSQLGGLQADDQRKTWAVRYLMHQAIDRPWYGSFQHALSRYLADSADLSLFGVLVRTTEPHEDDLARTTRQCEPVATPTSLTLRALYVGEDGLEALAAQDVEMETV